jgi:hypothetical protein
VLGSSAFDGVDFRVEWLLGELTEILWPLIIQDCDVPSPRLGQQGVT